MCNEFQQRYARRLIADRFAQTKIPLRWADPEPNRPLDQPVRPTDRVTVIRPLEAARADAGLEGLELRWWLVPGFHRGALKAWRSMCTNVRVETADTSPAFRGAYQNRRCLVPVSSYIEYTEPPGWKKGQPKLRHEIEWAGGDIRFFAGLWERATPSDHPEGLETVAFITGPAGPDTASISERAPFVLTLDQGMTWLRRDGPGKAMLSPPPAETFTTRLSPRESIMSAEMRRAL